MAFVLPNPSTPTNGQTGDATPILQNEQAIAAAIANFDGSQINAKSVTEAALADAINPRLRYFENFSPYVDSGCAWTALSGFNGTMTGGTIYMNGYRTIVSGVGSNTFNASTDTYIDIDYLGNLYYNGVANNATAPSLTANALRVARVVTSGSAITSVTQTGWDGLGNPILNQSPRIITLGQASVTSNQTGISTIVDLSGLSVTVLVPTGAQVCIMGATQYDSSTVDDYATTSIFEGTNQLSSQSRNLRSGGYYEGLNVFWFGTPTAGSHTYKLRGAGATSVGMIASATAPAYITVTAN